MVFLLNALIFLKLVSHSPPLPFSSTKQRRSTTNWSSVCSSLNCVTSFISFHPSSKISKFRGKFLAGYIKVGIKPGFQGKISKFTFLEVLFDFVLSVLSFDEVHLCMPSFVKKCLFQHGWLPFDFIIIFILRKSFCVQDLVSNRV